jgi:hypothetical protein
MNNMLEEFILTALEAFTNANGDIDKFELQLRRKLMTYNSQIPQISPTIPNIPAINVKKVDAAVSAMDFDDPIFKELENIDVHNMTDEDVLNLARRMGVMEIVDEEQPQEDE